MKLIRTIIHEYGKADIMKLHNFRQMARYDECDVILVKNFEIFGFAPDVIIVKIKYWNESGVKVVSVDVCQINCLNNCLNSIANSSKYSSVTEKTDFLKK